MSKFKVGERYTVGEDIVQEGGDVIEIAKTGDIFVEYKTVTGKYAFAKKMFCSDSVFANTLTLNCDRHELHITSDGTTTNAVYKLNGKVTKTAKAVCCPSDTFDFNTGAELAINRVLCGTDYNPKDVALKKPIEAMQNQPKEVVTLYCVKDFTNWCGIKWLTKGETYIYDKSGCIKFNGEYVTMKYSSYLEFCSKNPDISACLIRAEKRPAKVGEWVLITSDGVWLGKKYKTGEVYQINHINSQDTDRCYFNWCKPDELFFKSSEYLVLPDYKPEKVEPVYYSGKVVCVAWSGNLYTIGKVYEVVNGCMKNNNGGKSVLLHSFDEVGNYCHGKFIEYRGEQS